MNLRRRGPPTYELALLDHTHPTLPAAYRQPVRGLRLNVEVEDADAEWDPARRARRPAPRTN